MRVIVTLDDANGMMFNNRRQSQDSTLRSDILAVTKDNKLWMNEYSAKQFGEDLPRHIIIDEDFINKATTDEDCFVENIELLLYEDEISKLVVYRWNRLYPADMYFDIELSNSKWSMEFTEEFEGNFHKKITKEVWIKNEK